MSDENFVFARPKTVGVAVRGSEKLFPVRRIYCVGQNYAAHVKEMGGDERDPPIFFQKPTDAIVISGSNVPYPTRTENLHHEIELVIAIGVGGEHIAIEDAKNHVYGLATGLDLTRRDLQKVARESGLPWEIAKAFDHSAPIGEIVPLNGAALPTSGTIALSLNGETKQSGDLADLIWSCAEIVSTLSGYYRLEPGDLIYTGTPAGVGPVMPGDSILGSIEGLPDLDINITD